jgi:hypothetical protein
MSNLSSPLKETRSCFNCSHAHVWTDRDYNNKDFNTFECTHPNLSEDEDWVEPENYVTMTQEEFALYCARSCKDYERIRPNAQTQS